MAPTLKVAVMLVAICAILSSACGPSGTNQLSGEAAVIKIDGSRRRSDAGATAGFRASWGSCSASGWPCSVVVS